MADVTQKFDTIDSLTRDICAIAFNDPEARDYVIVSRAVHRAVEQLNFLVSPPIKSVKLTINDNLTVDLPDDCVRPIKVGVIHDGILKIFGQNDYLYNEALIVDAPNYGCSCQDTTTSTSTSSTTITGCPLCTFHNYGEAYGYRPKMWRNGSFRFDEPFNRLILGSGYDVEVGGGIIVEYISMTTADDLVLIDKRLFACIRQRVMSWLKQNSSPQEAAYAQREFNKEYKLAKALMTQTYSLQDLIAAFRGERKPGIKG